MVTLDAIDRKILGLLQTDSRMTMSMPKVGREDRRPSSNVNTNESG